MRVTIKHLHNVLTAAINDGQHSCAPQYICTALPLNLVEKVDKAEVDKCLAYNSDSMAVNPSSTS